MKLAIWLCTALCLSQAQGQAYKAHQRLTNSWDQWAMRRLMKLAEDVVYDTDSNWGQLEKLRYNSRNSAAYEIGYLMKTLQEFYRKQVDVYNTTKWMNVRLYLNEMVLYLDEVEHHYWQVDHVASMMHEIEQKYGIKAVIGAYGFEMTPELKKIFQGLSWSARMQLLSKYYPDPHPTNWSMEALLHTRPGPDLLRSGNGRRFGRRPPIEALRHPKDRRQFAEEPDPSRNVFLQKDDDNDMVLKLFRLMYETIRDSDLKVKRAELIKAHYVNSSAFEVGYLLGEVTEKYNIMTDIAATLKRLYAEWKPIEHINAYEQIANHGVEIGHLIDIIRTSHRETGKKEKGEKGEKGKPETEKVETEKNTNVPEGEKETQQSKKEAEIQRMFGKRFSYGNY